QHICINADAAEFSHPDFFEMVNSLLVEHDISAHQLHIEVTESSLIQRHAHVKKQLDLLKALGVCLALDDFGTGYASLSYLQQYPFDFIKVDKSFICNIETDRTQQAIVKAILDLAVALDMQVVAEGIETEQQRDVLLMMGCQYGQGYWFGKPVTAQAATEMLIQQYATKQT
ncbi:MAG: EAL domain-containing protein, partial [Psychrobacter sp.]|nr:EAL domain-containing protein [Psychrobacter sp.]